VHFPSFSIAPYYARHCTAPLSVFSHSLLSLFYSLTFYVLFSHLFFLSFSLSTSTLDACACTTWSVETTSTRGAAALAALVGAISLGSANHAFTCFDFAATNKPLTICSFVPLHSFVLRSFTSLPQTNHLLFVPSFFYITLPDQVVSGVNTMWSREWRAQRGEGKGEGEGKAVTQLKAWTVPGGRGGGRGGGGGSGAGGGGGGSGEEARSSSSSRGDNNDSNDNGNRENDAKKSVVKAPCQWLQLGSVQSVSRLNAIVVTAGDGSAKSGGNSGSNATPQYRVRAWARAGKGKTGCNMHAH
jgi:hypothetical protein